MATELNEQSTTEEVNAYVEEVVKEAAKEREEGSDARITAEHADNEHKDASKDDELKDAEDTTAESETTSEETGTEGQAEWLDDDLKAEVAAYGIDEEELADFTSREELERALRFLDRSALEAGRKAQAEGTETTRDENGRFTKEEPKEGKPESESGYEVKLDKDVYDDELVDEFSRMRDHYESRIAALESRFEDIAAEAETQQFDGIVDSLGHSDLFGKSGKENSKQLQRRQDLFVAVKAQQIGLQTMGRKVDLNESLVNRVARMVFAEDLGKKDLKARTRKLSAQSSKIMGGGTTRPQDPREDPRDEFDRLYKQLEGR